MNEEEILKNIFSEYKKEILSPNTGEIKKAVSDNIQVIREKRYDQRQRLLYVLSIVGISLLFIGMLVAIALFFKIDLTIFTDLFKSLNLRGLSESYSSNSSIWIMVGVSALLLLFLQLFLETRNRKKILASKE